MKCVSCGAAEMVYDTRYVQYIYKGQTTSIPAIKGEFCPLCGESIHDKDESARINALMMEFNKTVNSLNNGIE